MMSLQNMMIILQLFFYIFAVMYFYSGYKSRTRTQSEVKLESEKEVLKLKNMRNIKLTEPLSEKTRPARIEEIIGQEQGVKALRAALCGPNPQHMIIYGPPGIGKTAAARLILEEAKRSKASPFGENAAFIEIDATTLRFDERSIADPLIGSVHDPIYQGAGAYGAASVPQPKPGAVSKAHGGVLFIDEIGELHPTQMNKLLKVLEDRCVYFTSTYYSAEKQGIPAHIHDMFKNGMPADFRLIGATTRSPEEMPPALRSRCAEIFFDPLKPGHIKEICRNAIKKTGFMTDENVVEKIAQYASNGRECVNIVQTVASLALMGGENHLTLEETEWTLEAGRYTPKLIKKVAEKGEIGAVNGLAVYSGGTGALLEIEAVAHKAPEKGGGGLKITGIIEEEEIKKSTGSVKRSSTARASVENVLTVLEAYNGVSISDYIIHINFPGGLPADGPSAGSAMFTALYSAIYKKEIPPGIAFTGEVSLKGRILPVGGVTAKIEAAKEAGALLVLIPKDNWRTAYKSAGVMVKPVSDIDDILEEVFKERKIRTFLEKEPKRAEEAAVLSAKPHIYM